MFRVDSEMGRSRKARDGGGRHEAWYSMIANGRPESKPPKSKPLNRCKASLKKEHPLASLVPSGGKTLAMVPVVTSRTSRLTFAAVRQGMLRTVFTDRQPTSFLYRFTMLKKLSAGAS